MWLALFVLPTLHNWTIIAFRPNLSGILQNKKLKKKIEKKFEFTHEKQIEWGNDSTSKKKLHALLWGFFHAEKWYPYPDADLQSRVSSFNLTDTMPIDILLGKKRQAIAEGRESGSKT